MPRKVKTLVTNYSQKGASGWAAEIWRVHGAPAAQDDGWELFARDDTDELELQVINDPTEVPSLAAKGITDQLFADDVAALQHVLALARTGSRVHLLALYMDGRIATARTFVPWQLLDYAKLPTDLPADFIWNAEAGTIDINE